LYSRFITYKPFRIYSAHKKQAGDARADTRLFVTGATRNAGLQPDFWHKKSPEVSPEA